MFVIQVRLLPLMCTNWQRRWRPAKCSSVPSVVARRMLFSSARAETGRSHRVRHFLPATSPAPLTASTDIAVLDCRLVVAGPPPTPSASPPPGPTVARLLVVVRPSLSRRRTAVPAKQPDRLTGFRHTAHARRP